MKMLQITCFVLLLFGIGFGKMYAQEKTAYEKKKEELVLQLWSKFGKTIALIVTNTAEHKGDAKFIKDADELKKSGAKEIAALYGRSIPEYDATIWLADELKKAQKLKTAVDIKREQDAAYAKTDMGHLKSNIQHAFKKWNQKGEFEKEADYEQRLQTQSETAFEQVCVAQIKEAAGKCNLNRNSDYPDRTDLQRTLSAYDTESESFSVSFKINGISWQKEIDVPLDEAEAFKKNWNSLTAKIGEYDWCCIENSLCPTLVILENVREKAIYELPLTLNNQSDIAFAFDDFDIENPYLKDFVFSYPNAKKKEQQLFDAYRHQLDSIFQNYNRQLLQNPHNTAKETLNSYTEMERNGDKKANFTKSAYAMKADFEKLNAEIEKQFRQKKPTEYVNIFYSSNPDKKPEADKLYLECRCKYPKREDFDLSFIDGKTANCGCRENEYRENKALFSGKTDFDEWYDKGDPDYSFEVERRALYQFLNANATFLESMDFQQEEKESAGSAIGRTIIGAAIGRPAAGKDYSTENRIRKSILAAIEKGKNAPYYQEVLGVVIEKNKAMNKEWGKNGQKFDNKAAFYEAYISGNYKTILKKMK